MGITVHSFIDKMIVAFYLFVAHRASAQDKSHNGISYQIVSCMMLCTDKYFQLRSTIICLSNGQLVPTKCGGILWFWHIQIGHYFNIAETRTV